MRIAIMDWYQQTCDIVPRDCDRRATDRMIWTTIKRFCPPHLEEKAWEMIHDGKGIAFIKAQLTAMQEDQ